MYEVTLVGSKTSMTATTNDRNVFKNFVLWLDHFGLLSQKIEIGKYSVNDKQVKFCQKKADEIGLTV